jgi:hypothetical protein
MNEEKVGFESETRYVNQSSITTPLWPTVQGCRVQVEENKDDWQHLRICSLYGANQRRAQFMSLINGDK